MRALTQTFFIATTALSLAACNMILGNDVHELDRDASTSAGGSGGSGGAGGDAGQGGAMGSGGAGGQGGGAGGSAGQGGAGAGRGGAAGSSGAAGQGGAAGASGAAGQGGTSGRDAGIDDGAAGTVSRDVAIGDAPVDDTSTPIDGTIRDRNDDAADACTPNSTECRGRSLYLCTSTGTWIETLQCPYACVTGACSGMCVPGSLQCTGTTPQTCDDTGKWQNGTACPFVCTNGACTGMCVPGTTVGCGDVTTCNATATQTCDNTGTLGACTPGPSTCSAVPSGWQPVALAPSGTCPSGFGGAQLVLTSATGAPFTCSCGCSGSQSCGGTATLKRSGGDAGACPDQPGSTVTLNYRDTCVSANFGTIIAGYTYQLANPTYEPTPACGGGPTPTSQPLVVTQTTTVCFPNLSCPTGACLDSAQEANLCVSKVGVQTCPAGYPNATVVAQSYNDYRACGQCACSSSLTCALNGVILHNDSACGGGPPYVMTATTACSTGPSNYPLNAIIADGVSAGSPSCVETSPSMPVGAVELSSASTATVCCK